MRGFEGDEQMNVVGHAAHRLRESVKAANRAPEIFMKARLPNVKTALEKSPVLMFRLSKMDQPDIIDVEDGAFVFADCSPESPVNRRSLNYDQALEMAKKMGGKIIFETTDFYNSEMKDAHFGVTTFYEKFFTGKGEVVHYVQFKLK